MCSWGLVLTRGLAWGIGFGAAIVASAVSVCAPIGSVLLSGRKNLRALCLHSGFFPWLAQECGAWAWGRGERAPLFFFSRRRKAR